MHHLPFRLPSLDWPLAGSAIGLTIIGLLIRYEIVRGGALMAGVSALIAAIVAVGLFQPPDVDP